MIETVNNNNENKFIQSIELNGKSITQNYILHKDILKGGYLIFTMGKQPNKNVKNAMALSSKLYN